jgi:hypothetical protein
VANACPPSIHEAAPDDVRVQLKNDHYVYVGFLEKDSTVFDAGKVFVAGDTDRERLENLLAIAGRIRQGTLDLIAELASDDVAEVHTALGQPPSMPDAAPLHGTTTRASVVTL